jgi:hypothetical protein
MSHLVAIKYYQVLSQPGWQERLQINPPSSATSCTDPADAANAFTSTLSQLHVWVWLDATGCQTPHYESGPPCGLLAFACPL